MKKSHGFPKKLIYIYKFFPDPWACQEMSCQGLLPTLPLLAVKSDALECGCLGIDVDNIGFDL